MEKAPPPTHNAVTGQTEEPTCAYCGDMKGEDMILALWVGGDWLGLPKWFHVRCLIEEASHHRDKRVVVDVRYPH